jgi:ubiquinone/menaquinone biosynthesis C-methylase UbiE
MKDPKEYYRQYLADDNLSPLNHQLVKKVLSYDPRHVLEFGTGTGKNLKLIQSLNDQVYTSGIDVSLINVLHSIVKNGQRHVSIGDEQYLRHYCNYDCVITISCLDHIQDVSGIIQELQRIANKAVVIAECIDHEPEAYYYRHEYERFGFQKLNDSDHKSEGDGRMYYIWIWQKGWNVIDKGINDDFCIV